MRKDNSQGIVKTKRIVKHNNHLFEITVILTCMRRTIDPVSSRILGRKNEGFVGGEGRRIHFTNSSQLTGSSVFHRYIAQQVRLLPVVSWRNLSLPKSRNVDSMCASEEPERMVRKLFVILGPIESLENKFTSGAIL